VRHAVFSLWKTIVSLSIVCGLTGVFYLWPRLDVAPASGYESANDPMDAALSLTNSGSLTIYPEKVSCLISDYNWRSGFRVTGLTFDYLGGGTLEPGQTVDYVRQTAFEGPGEKVISADFIIIVKYHQWGWPWSLEKRYRFKAHRREDGLWVWRRPYLSWIDRHIRPNSRILYEPKATDE
jgi:hypothetical protein